MPDEKPIGTIPYAQGNFSPQSNSMATASLVLGVILFVPPCGLLAIIFGILGIRRASVCGKGKGMAISGLILGCVGLCIMPLVLTSLLLPSLNSPRPTANRIKSASNLRLIGQACIMYSNENAGKLPPDWGTVLMNEDLTIHVFISSASGTAPPSSLLAKPAEAAWVNANSDYVYLGAGNDSNAIPATTVIAYEKLGIFHGAGANVLFNDGHVDWMTIPAIKNILAQQGVTPSQ